MKTTTLGIIVTMDFEDGNQEVICCDTTDLRIKKKKLSKLVKKHLNSIELFESVKLHGCDIDYDKKLAIVYIRANSHDYYKNSENLTINKWGWRLNGRLRRYLVKKIKETPSAKDEKIKSPEQIFSTITSLLSEQSITTVLTSDKNDISLEWENDNIFATFSYYKDLKKGFFTSWKYGEKVKSIDFPSLDDLAENYKEVLTPNQKDKK